MVARDKVLIYYVTIYQGGREVAVKWLVSLLNGLKDSFIDYDIALMGFMILNFFGESDKIVTIKYWGYCCRRDRDTEAIAVYEYNDVN